MDPAMRYQEILRTLAIVDEGFAGDQAGLVLGPSSDWARDRPAATGLHLDEDFDLVAEITAQPVRRPTGSVGCQCAEGAVSAPSSSLAA
jgi:hypothetical protein